MIRKMCYIFNRKQKIRLLELLFIIIVNAFFELLGVTIILPFVNLIVDMDNMMNNEWIRFVCELFSISSIYQCLSICVIAIICVYLFKNLFSIFVTDVLLRFVMNNRKRLSCRIMQCYMKQPYLFHLVNNSEKLISDIDSDTTMFFTAVQSFLQLITELMVCFVLVCYLFFTDSAITVAIVIAMILFVLFYVLFFKKKLKIMSIKKRDSIANTRQIMLQAFQGIKEVKILNRENYFVDEFKIHFSEFADYTRKSTVLISLPRPVMEFVCIAGIMMAVLIKLSTGVEMVSFVSTMSVFVIAAFRMLPSFSRMAGHMGTIMYNRAGVEAVYSNLKDTEKMEQNCYITETKSDNRLRIKEEIKIQNLTFKYPGNDQNVLENINITIPANSSVAFVGPSGQGKTTLADLILGVLEPQKGKILSDDLDIHSDIHAWFSNIGYIAQTIYLMDDTIEKNIALGLEQKNINRERVWAVLQESQLREFVESLPEGLDTIVGEAGIRLSGGQRQRIGIARALYNDPDILILDEATSALDNETESAVMDAINALAGRKTMVIIAHRLTTIENCDMIYEISHKNAKLLKK